MDKWEVSGWGSWDFPWHLFEDPSVGLPLYLFAVWLSHINQKYFSIIQPPTTSSLAINSPSLKSLKSQVGIEQLLPPKLLALAIKNKRRLDEV